jgi:hypothetical protein
MKINIVDMAEVRKLEEFIGDKMYSAAHTNGRGWLEIAVVIPQGSLRGLPLYWQAMKAFSRAAWEHLA